MTGISRRITRNFVAFWLFTALMLAPCCALVLHGQESPAKPAAEPAKPAAEPAKPAAEPAKPAAEPAKPAAEPAKPAAEPAKPAAEPAKPAAEPAKPQPAAEDGRPVGPDDLFPELPSEGLHKGVVPASFHKVVILQLPNPGSKNTQPDQDLPGNARFQAIAFRLMLEQYVDYMPHLYTCLPQLDAFQYGKRLRHGEATLRNADVPRAGFAVAANTRYGGLEAAARRYGADLVFALSFDAGADGASPRGAAFRYRAGKGVEASAAWDFGSIAKPEADSQVKLLDGKVRELCAGLEVEPAVLPGEKPVTLPFAPVPRLTANDKAMRELARVVEALERLDLSGAWVAWEDLLKLDATCGRAALYGAELFRAQSVQATTSKAAQEHVRRSLETAAQGVKCSPNDVMLRMRLCRLGNNWFSRGEWALKGLEQALQVQPANAHLLDAWVNTKYALERDQLLQWVRETALKRLPDSRGPYLLATLLFQFGRFSEAMPEYERAIAMAPNEHEYRLSLGLCATYEGERLQKLDLPGAQGDQARADAEAAFASAAESLEAAQQLDPSELLWAYEFHVRAATRSHTWLPTDPDAQERLLLSQAVFTGLQSSSKTFKFDRLLGEQGLATSRRYMRAVCREADAKDPLYEIKLLARLNFARHDLSQDDGSRDELMRTLSLLRAVGHRSPAVDDAMNLYGPALDAWEAAQRNK
ncbi:MAG: hypothetical protein IT463_06820 [Planctomycetes bacterium]|nr:hypothetical protein [Planctomycetota bacterium]